MSSSRDSSAGYDMNKISYKVLNSLNVTLSDVFELKYLTVHQGLSWKAWKFQSYCVTIYPTFKLRDSGHPGAIEIRRVHWVDEYQLRGPLQLGHHATYFS